MKKMYNNPKTEQANLATVQIICTSPTITVDDTPTGGVADAPARKGNPLQGQIKL